MRRPVLSGLIALALVTATSSAPAFVPAASERPTGTPSAGSTRPAPSLPLAGRRVVLDPGHNGGNSRRPDIINKPVDAGGFRKPCNTTGTSTNAGYHEHAFTFDVARRAAVVLRRLGATVTLTRTTDTGVGPCVNRRAAIGNAARADAVISIHADGASSAAHGFHVIEPALAPDKGNRAILEPSDRLARVLRDTFAADTGLARATYPGGIVAPGLARRADLAGLNLSRRPVAMIECGNMRNASDAAFLRSAAGRAKAARAVAEAVVGFLS